MRKIYSRNSLDLLNPYGKRHEMDLEIDLGELDSFREYCCKDAFATRLIAEKMIAELKRKDLWNYYIERVQPLTRVIIAMNRNGVYINSDKRDKAIVELDRLVKENKKFINDIAGREVNISGDDLGIWLFEELRLPGGKKTKKSGKWSTEKSLLKEIKASLPEMDEVFDAITSIKESSHLINSFLEVTQDVDDNGRLHPNFKIGPVTGRLACLSPNFMAVPKGICRSVYSASDGKIFVGADYKQLELRIFAINSGAKRLIKVFEEGKDPHRMITADAMGKPVEDVEDWERKIGKNFVFGMIFGAGDDTLVRTISKAFKTGSMQDRYEAGKRAKSLFFRRNPEALIYRNKIKRELEKTRMLYTREGRPRIFFEKTKDALGQAGNYPMQGSAAGIMNECMVDIHREDRYPMLMQVHDFLLLEPNIGEEKECARFLKEKMEKPIHAFDGYIFPVDVKIGNDWSEV